MIQSAYFLCRGLGGDGKLQDGSDKCVGNAWLGDWLGEKKLQNLQESSKLKEKEIADQVKLNEAHKRIIQALRAVSL